MRKSSVVPYLMHSHFLYSLDEERMSFAKPE